MSASSQTSKNLAVDLESWFARVRRPMPWRKHPAPYQCWLSEIMMQQTTYATVLPYYRRFLKRFPTVAALAKAEEQSVLKAWEGLGYYARARNLLAGARQIVKGVRAVWPKTAAEWMRIPGVGPYTAAALASVLNGERTPVVDGNVARVFARYWLLEDDFSKLPTREKLAKRLQGAIDASQVPGDFNQAMMELGALVCTPTNPACANCPLSATCRARRTGAWADYPVKTTKKTLPVRKASAVIVQDSRGRVLLVQNREGGLLKGLWELPSTDRSVDVTQVFSHFRFELNAARVTRSDAVFRDPGAVPLTTSTRKALAAANIVFGEGR